MTSPGTPDVAGGTALPDESDLRLAIRRLRDNYGTGPRSVATITADALERYLDGEPVTAEDKAAQDAAEAEWKASEEGWHFCRPFRADSVRLTDSGRES